MFLKKNKIHKNYIKHVLLKKKTSHEFSLKIINRTLEEYFILIFFVVRRFFNGGCLICFTVPANIYDMQNYVP